MFAPERVAAALARAERVGFTLSCEPLVGQLLSTLAATIPIGGRILELGTGVGYSLAWLVEGIRERDDVEIISVDIDLIASNTAAEGNWPAYVQLLIGDAVELLPGLGDFDLIFADAQGGKWTGLDLTIRALRPGGILVVDDMDLSRYSETTDRSAVDRVRQRLMSHSDCAAVELEVGSGIILAAKRRNSP